MERTYTMTELSWAKIEEGGIRQPVEGILVTPAQFESDDRNAWSLRLWLERPVSAGETMRAPVTPLVAEAAESLLVPGGSFRLMIGPHKVAIGRILSIQHIPEGELKRLLHFC